MVFVFFSSINPNGKFTECSFGGPDIDSCFDTLNVLASRGWQLVGVKLLVPPGKVRMELPVEAFTGEVMRPQLVQLERTWKYLLEDQTVMIKQQAVRTIHHAAETLLQVREKREHTKRRIKNLLERFDSIQARIEETKSKWGVV